MAGIIYESAMKDLSFAGPYPYASNTPQKVFAGEERSVPIGYVMEALNEIQSGQAAPVHTAIIKGALHPKQTSCMSKCQNEFNNCLGGDMTKASSDQVVMCSKKFKDECMASCSST